MAIRCSVAALSFATMLAVASAQADGNPHLWNRQRRCDHTDYTPKCGACEGIGGIVKSDKASDIVIPACTPVSGGPGKRPVWGTDFTETKSHEILIGKKTDPACFQAFPSNDSTSTNCYKPQECVLTVDFKDKKAMRVDANQAGNAWGIFGNVTSVIYHQGTNMWITNHLPLKVTQTICTKPKQGGDKTQPAIYPVQFNWVDNLFFVARETLDVEYGVGSKTMDHWAFGPHHAWVDPATGLIVRMWQPFNGLQIFTPGTFNKSHDPKALEELSADGSTAPKAALKGGSTFRIKCQDNGFPVSKDDDLAPAGASSSDLQRARTKKPRDHLRGDDFEKMARTLNGHLRASGEGVKECDLWAVEELQQFQVLLMALSDPSLNKIYHETADNRRIRHETDKLVEEWTAINRLAETDQDLAKMHRDGHCHEAVMWYVHHLPEDARMALKGKVTLPLLSYRHHQPQMSSAAGPHGDVARAYQEKVTCFSCHSNALPHGAWAQHDNKTIVV